MPARSRRSKLIRKRLVHHSGGPFLIGEFASAAAGPFVGIELFDDLVGTGYQRDWDIDAKRFGSLEVDGQP